MAGRDGARLERARRTVAERSGSTRVETRACRFREPGRGARPRPSGSSRHTDRLDLLVNNAGLIAPRFQLSADGYELTIAVNHLAPFLLTNLLIDRLRASAPLDKSGARIVTGRVASPPRRAARPRRRSPESGLEPAQGLRTPRSSATSSSPAPWRGGFRQRVVAFVPPPRRHRDAIGDRAGSIAGFGLAPRQAVSDHPENGAATSLFLATTQHPAPFHGAYVIGKRVALPDPTALDDELGESLWAESARLVGL